jgi:hypothetical protein
MSFLLKQSTAVTVKMGPFVDSTDGNTQETGLTISQADIRLSKNGGAYAQTNNATGATHDEKGNYGVPLDTTDTGTLRTLRVHIHESGALAVCQDFMVIPANAYDSLVLGTDELTTDVAEWLGTAVNEHTAGYPAVTIKDGTGTGELATTSGKIDEVTTLTGHTAQTGDSYARLGAPAGASVSADIAAVKAETALIVADTNEVQGKLPDNKIMGSSVTTDKDDEIDAIKAVTDTLNDPTVAAIADGVWDEATAGHVAAGSFGAQLKTVLDAVKAETDNLPSAVKKNTQLANFPFILVLSADHVTGATGKSVTAERSLDGAAFSGCANSATEVSAGMYKITLAAGDLNGDTVVLKFTASGCDTRFITIVTKP